MNQIEKKIEIEVILEFNDFSRNIFWQTFKRVWLIIPLALLLTSLAIYSISLS